MTAGASQKKARYKLPERRGLELPRLDRAQRILLRHIADHADYLVTECRHDAEAHQWLLVPLPDYLLDRLAEFEADLEDSQEHDGCEPEEDEQSLTADTWGPGYMPLRRIPIRTIRRKRRERV